jgi:hypothetical protein
MVLSAADGNKHCLCLLLKLGGRRKVPPLPCDDPQGVKGISYAEWIANPLEQLKRLVAKLHRLTPAAREFLESMQVAERMCLEKIRTNPASRHQTLQCRSASV